jgi:predicted neutral ceramidase superfamily lipid hydrolase
MQKSENLGFGDFLIVIAFLLMIMKWTGVLTVSWIAINHFNLFVLIYLVICFIVDLTIKVVDTAVKSRGK